MKAGQVLAQLENRSPAARKSRAPRRRSTSWCRTSSATNRCTSAIWCRAKPTSAPSSNSTAHAPPTTSPALRCRSRPSVRRSTASVSLRHIKIGNTIQVQQPGLPASLRLASLQAHIFVPERDIHKLAAGQPAVLVVDAWPGKQFTRQVSCASIRWSTPGTGTVKVTVRDGRRPAGAQARHVRPHRDPLRPPRTGAADSAGRGADRRRRAVGVRRHRWPCAPPSGQDRLQRL